MPIYRKINDVYSYVGEEPENGNYEYDSNKFGELMANHKYTEAANYLSNFRFNNEDTNNAMLGQIQILRTEGEKLEHLYGQAKTAPNGQDRVDASIFRDAVFNSNVYNAIPSSNKYKNQFDRIKKTIGGDEYKDNYAETIDINFKPKSRKYLFDNKLGDLLARDNDFNIDNFASLAGIDIEDYSELKDGLKIKRNDDGSAILSLDMNGKLSNKILYHLGEMYSQEWTSNLDGTTNLPIISGKNNNGSIKRTDFGRTVMTDVGPMTRSYENKDKIYWDKVYKLYQGIETAKGVQRELELDFDEEPIIYNSFSLGTIGENLDDLNNKYAAGALTETQYLSAVEGHNKLINARLNAFDLSVYDQGKVYGKWDTEDTSEESNVLKELNPKEKMAFAYQLKTAAANGLVQMNYMVSGNKIGTQIIVLPKAASEKDTQKSYYSKPMTLFIENLYSDEIKSSMAADNETSATYILNNMQYYGFPHKVDGGTVKLNQNDGTMNYGYYIPDKTKDNPNPVPYPVQTAEEFKHIIKLDTSKRMLENQLIRKHFKTNETIDEQEFLKDAKEYSAIIANNLYNEYYEPIPIETYFPELDIKEDNYSSVLDSLTNLNIKSGILSKGQEQQIFSCYDIFDYLCKRLYRYNLKKDTNK